MVLQVSVKELDSLGHLLVSAGLRTHSPVSGRALHRENTVDRIPGQRARPMVVRASRRACQSRTQVAASRMAGTELHEGSIPQPAQVMNLHP